MYYDMSNYKDTDKRSNESIGSTIKEAERNMDNLPYWGMAIQNSGLVRTICDSDGVPIRQRSYAVRGVGCERVVVVSGWYDC